MGAIVDPTKKADKPRRRKRRPGAKAKPAAPEESVDAWLDRANALRDRVAAAFEPLDVEMSADDDLSLVIALPANMGTFRLVLAPEKRVVELLSPVSGGQTYKWDAREAAWKHVTDGHDVTGMLVRDYLRAGCVGLPNL